MNKKKLTERRLDENLHDEQIRDMINRRLKKLEDLGFVYPLAYHDEIRVEANGTRITIENKITKEILFLKGLYWI